MARAAAELSTLPEVLLLRRPSTAFDDALSKKFRLIKPWESPLPLPLFLSRHAASVRALFISGLFPVSAETLAALPSLECIVNTSVGLNHIDLDECRRRRIAIAGSGALFSEDVADCAVGLLTDVLRRISASDVYVRGGQWLSKGDYPLGFKLSGKRVGIIGLGSIGYKIAKRVEAFGCTILYTSRENKPSVPYTYFSNVCDLATESHALIVTCTLTSKTRHIVNKDVLAALGKDGVVINVGRGALIDEKELVRCLMQGEIGGAGLDVFEDEPAVPDEFLSMDNVVLSPHAASCTIESISDLIQLMIANLEAFFANRPLLTPVRTCLPEN